MKYKPYYQTTYCRILQDILKYVSLIIVILLRYFQAITESNFKIALILYSADESQDFCIYNIPKPLVLQKTSTSLLDSILFRLFTKVTQTCSKLCVKSFIKQGIERNWVDNERQNSEVANSCLCYY